MKPKLITVQPSSATRWLLCITLLPLIAACGATESSIVREARQAEEEGRIIDNEMMLYVYPKSFRKGHPHYLERDFEAGVNFMCDEFRAQYGKDVCAEPEIHWRR